MTGMRHVTLLLSLTVMAVFRMISAYNCVHLYGAAGSCYIFKVSPKSWREAVSDCVQRHSGHLVTLETEAESKAIQGHIRSKTHGGSHYVGAISIDGHSSWFWYHTGAVLADNRWIANNGRNCLALSPGIGRSGGLTAAACWDRKSYVCEVPTPDYAGDYGNFRLEERSNDWPWG